MPTSLITHSNASNKSYASVSTGSSNPRSSGSLGQAGRGPTPQIVLIELKQRIFLALNKLADRDTQHIAAEELERIAETLSPEGISLCLSCLYDTDLQQKPAVRKECVKMFGTLASFHNDQLAPHLAKIVNNIVRRLKDPDSSIRDACVDAMGTLAAKVPCKTFNSGTGGGEGVLATFAGPLGVFCKPLFDALNEQHRGVQVGAAMCLAGVIDNFKCPPSGSLQRLCPRIIKLLNSATFAAKAALLSVIASIVQVGGVTSHQCLTLLMACIQDCLKSNDWATRKAAAETFACMGSSVGAPLGTFKLQVLEALDACRFDKVKPVRDSVVQTLQVWKGIATLELPADRSGVQDNVYKRNPDEGHMVAKKNDIYKDDPKRMITSFPSFEGCFGFGHARSGCNKISCENGQQAKRMPFIDKGTNADFFQKLEKKDVIGDWQVDIAIPKTPISGLEDPCESCSKKHQTVLASKEQMPSHCSDVTHGELSSSGMKEIRVTMGRSGGEVWDRSSNVIENHVFEESIGMSSSENQSFKIESDNGCWIHGTSLVSSSSSISEGRVTNAENDSTFIRKQLCQIEDQQLKLLDMLQKFIIKSEENFSRLEVQVTGIESNVCNLVRRMDDIEGRYCNAFGGSGIISSKFSKKQENQTQDRPILSENVSNVQNGYNSKPRSLSESGITGCSGPQYGAAASIPLPGSLLSDAPAKSSRVRLDISSDNLFKRAEGAHMMGNKVATRVSSTSKLGEGPSARSSWQASKDETTLTAIRFAGEDVQLKSKVSDLVSSLSSVGSNAGAKGGGYGKGSFWSLWSRAAAFLRSGDVDSAYVEVLCTGDNMLLVRLMSRTGPVLEKLSSGTAHELLRTIIQLLLQQSFLDIILPWMQQVADLVVSSGPDCMGLSLDVKKGLIASLEEVSSIEHSELWIAKTLREIALQLTSCWGLLLPK